MNELERCLKDRRLIKVTPDGEMIGKELRSAAYYLDRAKSSIDDMDIKWAAIQAYYSMFHAAKALVLSKGCREKNHYCMIVVLKEPYVLNGEVDKELLDDLEMCMAVRHSADYSLMNDTASSEECIRHAGSFLKKATSILLHGEGTTK